MIGWEVVMMKSVFVHLHDAGDVNWDNRYFDFDRIPVEGEYLSTDVDWYKIELVVHTPLSMEMSAEIFAVKVDFNEEMKRKLNT